MAGSKTVTVLQICKLMAGIGMEPMTKQAISEFVKEGMPKAARGRYDPVICMGWYLARLRTVAKQRAGEGANGKVVSRDDAHRRLILAKAESEELTLAQRRGELIPIHQYEATLTHLVQITKQRILNIPARLGPKLQDCTAIEIKALLNASLKDALMEISRKEVPSVAKTEPDAAVPSKPKSARPRNAGKPKPRKR